ncbi:hypothetical protein P5V15_014767 [Pogonomyrmex californicus]
MLQLTNKESCHNYNNIIKNNYQRLKHLTKRINSLYKTQNTKTKRGLIDGIGTVAKTLFGTMDNDDRKLINEQLNILHNKQQTTEHIIKNQIKIINATIAHINNHEKIIQNNENILTDAIKKLETIIIAEISNKNIKEHFIVTNAILDELTQHAENTLEYLIAIKSGILHLRLIPLEEIIENFKETTTQISQELYFSFKIREEDWTTMEKLTTMSAHCDKTHIYRILYFPLISLPIYEILNIIPLLVPHKQNLCINRNQPTEHLRY